MATHVVQKGETLSAIARKYGYTDWRVLFNLPDNADFKKKRPNPNLIFPGDLITLPDRRPAYGQPVASPPNDDEFQSAEYSVSYRSERGRLSKYLRVCYKDGTQKDIHLDSIAATQPNLLYAKHEALKVMDDYNANFILAGAFPVVFQILTMAATTTPATELPTAPNRGIPKRLFAPSSEILE